MKNAIAILAVTAMLTGCAMPDTRSSHQKELQNIANCFFDATSIMQNEPPENGSLAIFLREAKSKQKSKGTGDFTKLQWDESGNHIQLSYGPKVYLRITARSHDDFDNGASATRTTYEFFTKEDATTAKVAVHAQFGRPE
jgi:hypothetical protein